MGAQTSHALIPVANNAARVYIKSNGKVGIGNNNPTHLLDVGTNGAYCSEGAWADGSSPAYESNIHELTTEEALTALRELNPVRYTYTANPDEECLGFIAKDVPDLVPTADGKGLAPMDIVAVLTSVVQQRATIEDLEGSVDELAAQNAALGARMAALEAALEAALAGR